MKFLVTIVAVFGLSATAFGAAVPQIPQIIDNVIQTDYDAIVVGGGPSGLAALSGLARVRRNALLIDSGQYRNSPTRHAHDVLGSDGVTPAWYRYSARQQISHYDTVTMTNGTVTKIEPRNNNTYFTVMAEMPGDPVEIKVMTAKKIILATGLKDDLPNTPGVRENFGKGIYWCPWCDGHEHADQELGILAPLSKVPSRLREMSTLHEDIIAFVNGTDTPENRQMTAQKEPQYDTVLMLNNVTIDNRTITSIERLQDGEDEDADPSLPSVPEHDLFRINFNIGPSISRNSFLIAGEESQASQVGTDMGVELWGPGMASNLAKGCITNVWGVYAVGDANADNATNIPHALFTGKRAAVFLHVQLAREREAAQLKTYNAEHKSAKRAEGELERDLWSRMNGQPGEILYAGDFDQWRNPPVQSSTQS